MSRTRLSTGLALAAAAAVLTAVPATASGPSPVRASQHDPAAHWVSAWQGSPVGGGTIEGASCPADKGLADQTVRNIVFLSAGGDRVRVRLTNAFGTRPLQVGSASVALAGSGAATVPGSSRPVRFAGRSSVLIAAGGEALSDPVPLRVRALQKLAVSVYLPQATGPATQHWDAQQDNFLAAGNRAAAPGAAGFGTTISCWMFADGVDVHASPRVAGTVVTLGDSITDGFLSTNNADRRYPDFLARRLQALPGRTLSVSNAGISGNALLTFRTDLPFGVVFGPPAPARLARDVLTQAGARSVILLEGINDIGAFSARASDLIQADQQIIAQAHAAGLPVFGATLVPFGGSNGQYGGDYGTAAGERQRQRLNHWIRTSGAFDAVFDFDRALRDPARPDRMLPRYDSGDHLHPGDVGYRKMAETVDLRTLLRATGP
ncbi:MAG TPA: SGNH/GDSL hydrolase family protein [Mycobacteriales bacterium]|nr:SGNH/GDSL hydrolase family protein [Mycobacteriales bacterium]